MIESYIRFANNVTIPTIAVYGRKEFYKGADRELMDIRLASTVVDEYNFDEILLNEKNLETIVLGQSTQNPTNKSGKDEFEHTGYVFLGKRGLDTIDDFLYYRIILYRRTEEEQRIKNIEDKIKQQTLDIANFAVNM